jgi:hypothetical protein
VAHVSYDARKVIRETIGTSRWDFNNQRDSYTMDVTKNNGEPSHIPLLLSEECRSGSLPEMPYIKMHRALTRYVPHNIQGSVRMVTSYIDFKLYFTNIDDIDIVLYKQKILDALQNAVRNNQSTTTGLYWVNIEDERDVEEEDGGQVVFVYILTVLVQIHDSC